MVFFTFYWEVCCPVQTPAESHIITVRGSFVFQAMWFSLTHGMRYRGANCLTGYSMDSIFSCNEGIVKFVIYRITLDTLSNKTSEAFTY